MFKLSIGTESLTPSSSTGTIELERIGKEMYLAADPERVHLQRTYIEEYNSQKVISK